jgi:DNA-binding response OmpR family regulator
MSERILIVDDDPWIVRMVSAVLEKRGYQLVTAAGGEEALRKASEVQPALIITDVMMPGLDGWGLVRGLRARAELSLIPVIFLTALGGEEDRLQGFRLGADDYLAKPFRFEELELRVANALKKRAEARAKAEEMAAAETAPAAAKKAPAIHGTLEQLGLSALLVMIEMERKSGVLAVRRAGAAGRLFAREGRIIAARVDGDRAPESARKGAAAVYHMLTWSEGQFDFSAVQVEAEDEIQMSTTGLLMEGARLIDEAAR